MSEKKIGILTYHRVSNFGSLLQTYALQQYLIKKGNEVEVIDYYPERLRMKRLLFHVSPNWSRPFLRMTAHLIPAVISRLLGYHMMNRFLHKYIKLTEKSFASEDELLANLPQADIYMNGSDQIWNLDTSDGKTDRVFFMAFLSKKKIRTAYAGSFGKDDFSEEELTEIKKYLSDYKSISVRENTGLDILRRIGIDNGVWVLDPVFLLKKEEWLQIVPRMKLPHNYLLVYNLNRNPKISEMAQKIAKDRNLDIVNFAHSFLFIKGAKNIIYPTPNSFIALFANAGYVITDSFHGTAFSINFNKQFVCIPAPRFNSRLESVLSLFGLRERLIYDWEDYKRLETEIDYMAVNRILETERVKAYKYIECMLNCD